MLRLSNRNSNVFAKVGVNTHVAEQIASGHIEQNSGVQSGWQLGIRFSSINENGPCILLFTVGIPEKKFIDEY